MSVNASDSYVRVCHYGGLGPGVGLFSDIRRALSFFLFFSCLFFPSLSLSPASLDGTTFYDLKQKEREITLFLSLQIVTPRNKDLEYLKLPFFLFFFVFFFPTLTRRKKNSII